MGSFHSTRHPVASKLPLRSRTTPCGLTVRLIFIFRSSGTFFGFFFAVRVSFRRIASPSSDFNREIVFHFRSSVTSADRRAKFGEPR